MTQKIERLRTGSDEPKYGYRGYVIQRETRDWDRVRGEFGHTPKVQWLVRLHAGRGGSAKRPLESFNTRRDALAWIDGRPDAL